MRASSFFASLCTLVDDQRTFLFFQSKTGKTYSYRGTDKCKKCIILYRNAWEIEINVVFLHDICVRTYNES